MLFRNDLKLCKRDIFKKVIDFSKIISVLRYIDHRPPNIIVIPTEKIQFVN